MLNYVETTYGGQRAVTPADRLRARSTGIPTCACSCPRAARRGDRSSPTAWTRRYRQHGSAVRPRLSKPPSEYLYTQVYASFQHDRSAVQANVAMGWQNVLWGSDYPHYEGTFGHTQKTLHELFDDVARRGQPPHPHRRLPGALPARPRPAGRLTAGNSSEGGRAR